MKLFGRYHETNYIIEDEAGKELYHAGNSPHDSQVYLPSAAGVSVAQMKKWCADTLVEMCEEDSADNGGVFYDEDGDTYDVNDNIE